MATRWLIDGMNLIGSRAGRWWEDPDQAIRDLVRELEAYVAATGEPVTVVFDYRPKGLRVGTSGQVKAQFGDGRRQAADDLIVRTVRELADPAAVQVVTSDAGLRRAVEASGGAVTSTTSFRHRLEGVAGRRSRRGRR